MAVNEVKMNGETLISLASDTVSSSNLLSGATAHNAAGVAVEGAVVVPTKTSQLTNDSGFVVKSSYAPFTIVAIPDVESVMLVWNKVTNATGYVVKSGDGNTQYTAKTITANSVLITGLNGNTEYSFAIYSYINSKWYGPSELAYATTYSTSTGALFEDETEEEELPVFDESEVIPI